MTVRPSDAQCQRDAVWISDQVAFAAEFAPICRVRACSAPPGAGNAGTIDTGSAQVELASLSQFIQQQLMQLLPDTRLLPVSQTVPAGHAATTAHILR